MAQVVEDSRTRERASEFLDPIKKAVEQGKKDRGRMEPVWHSNRAYGAGKYWLKWSRGNRRLMLDPRDVAHGMERLSIDILTQNLWTALGQLAGAEARRNLLFRREDVPSEMFTEAANAAVRYGWEHEWHAKRKLNQVKRKLLIDGTAAIECYFDPTVGKEIGQMPVRGGVPIYDGEEARSYVADLAGKGERADYKLLREGRICWHPRSVFQLIVPPGIEDDEAFPWEATIEAVSLDHLIDRYGDAAVGLRSEPLAVHEQLGLKDSVEGGFDSEPEGESGTPGKLEGYGALVKYRERPSTKHPRGREVHYCQERLLEVVPHLPYQLPNGDYHSGVVYFHYWRVEGRFWGRGLIEPGKGIQRTYNKRAQQEATTIDRGQPYILADKNSKLKRTEVPLEVVEHDFAGSAPPPQAVAGIPVHDSIWRSKQDLKEDLQTAMGIHSVSTGEAPQRETTYAELAMRAEQDKVKLDPIFEEFQDGVGRLQELAVDDIRRYWSTEKLKAIAGEEGYAETVHLKASEIPSFFLTELADNARPRPDAAQVQLVMDLWRADGEESATTGKPRKLTLAWLHASLQAMKPLDFPETAEDIHTRKARWENSLIRDGDVPKPVEYDPPDIHLPIHREDQVEAEMAGDWELWHRHEEHIALTLELQDLLITQQANEQAMSQANLEASIAGAEAQAGEQAAQAEQARSQEAAEIDQQRALELEQAKQKGAEGAQS